MIILQALTQLNEFITKHCKNTDLVVKVVERVFFQPTYVQERGQLYFCVSTCVEVRQEVRFTWG